jgi:hypothetical protein
MAEDREGDNREGENREGDNREGGMIHICVKSRILMKQEAQ